MESKTKVRIVFVIIVALTVITIGCASKESDMLRELPDGNFTILSEQYLAGSLLITVVHDNDRNATCWITDDAQKGGISCIPDWQLTPPQTSNDCNCS